MPLSTACCEATGSTFHALMSRFPSAIDVVMVKSVTVEVNHVLLMPLPPITLATAWLMVCSVDAELDARPKYEMVAVTYALASTDAALAFIVNARAEANCGGGRGGGRGGGGDRGGRGGGAGGRGGGGGLGGLGG